MPTKRKAIGLASFASLLAEPVEASGPSATPSTQASETAAGFTDHDERPAKKRRQVGLLGEGYEISDATGMVPFFQKASDVPRHLQKYFAQRERFFSLYSEGCLLDEEGWYSVTPERIANQIADRCRCDTILDAFCGVGGNAIAFAMTCERVIALDTSPVRLALARHNAAIYGVEDRIEFILADYISFARTYSNRSPSQQTIDAVFLSPPWGGPNYLSSPIKTPGGHPLDVDVGSHPVFTLQSILPVHGQELFTLTTGITSNIAYYLPRNLDLEEVARLTPKDRIEVEEEWMGDKLKAVTCYFGGLVSGQGHLL